MMPTCAACQRAIVSASAPYPTRYSAHKILGTPAASIKLSDHRLRRGKSAIVHKVQQNRIFCGEARRRNKPLRHAIASPKPFAAPTPKITPCVIGQAGKNLDQAGIEEHHCAA